MVECRTLHGGRKLIPVEHLSFRPSVYAIVSHQGKILLTGMRNTGKYSLPGGGINLGERIEEALKREVREETGIEIDIDILELVSFREDFFYYDPSGEAFHSGNERRDQSRASRSRCRAIPVFRTNRAAAG
jgi:8-oxo-dGTP pyrophosphatase MutT (NUDIX family)